MEGDTGAEKVVAGHGQKEDDDFEVSAPTGSAHTRALNTTATTTSDDPFVVDDEQQSSSDLSTPPTPAEETRAAAVAELRQSVSSSA